MRVLVVNLGYPPNVVGGVELFVQSLARELVRRGIRASAASLSQNRYDWQYDDNGVRAYFMNAHPMGIALLDPKRTVRQRLAWHALGEANIWVARKLGAIVDQERPDIVHTHSLLGLSVNAWRSVYVRGVPIVHTLHDYQLVCPRGTMFRQGQPCGHQCRSCTLLTVRRRRASALPAAVVGISNFILQTHLTHGYFPSAIHSIIPNSYTPAAVMNGIREASDGRLRIGFIGRLHPTKGIEVLLEALRRLPPDRYVGKIAGSGRTEYEARLRRMAIDLPVDFMGWTRPDQFYRDIDVLVVPSTYNEPQGIVLIEAATLGVPTIYSTRGGLGEMGAEVTGFLPFDPAKSGSLGDQLLRLIETPSALSRLKASIAPAPQRFGIEERVRSYLQLYDKVLRIGATSSPVRADELSSAGRNA